MTPGTVYLVGAGPGDPELITVKARRVLGEADVVVYDHLVAPELLDLAPQGCERVFVGKKGGQLCRPQSEIDGMLVSLALGGRTVVRLKGGDPFVFGRGGEEATALAAAGISFEIVPGVTAALAAAAYAGIPLTHRLHSSSVVLLTGHEDPAKAGGTVRWEDIDASAYLVEIRGHGGENYGIGDKACLGCALNVAALGILRRRAWARRLALPVLR